MREHTLVMPRGPLRQALASAGPAEPDPVLPRRSLIGDVALAVLVVTAQLIEQAQSRTGAGITGGIAWQVIVAAVVTSAPVAARRRFPLATYLVLVCGLLVTIRYATDIAFLVVVFAGYSAVLHSRFRGAALIGVPLVWTLAGAVIWRARPDPGYDWVPMAVLVLVALGLIATVGYAAHVEDSRARMHAEHEAATQRALEMERARIASELHDVVTHNVSVMIVQAGAARQVLADAPDEARAALMAVEASGRAAMTELRNLLGLLSPAPAEGEEAAGTAGTAGQDLQPQPGLAELPALIERLTAAGLAIDLQAGELPRALSPGLDLAAFRVIQEALTNVIKHAGRSPTTVCLDYRRGELVVEVADTGRGLAPAPSAVPLGAKRGLLGLRERIALYGGELDAGPRPGGGWLVRARVPLDPPPARPAGATQAGSARLASATVRR